MIHMQSYFDPKTGELIGGEIGAEPQNNSQYQQNFEQNYQQNFGQNFGQDYQQNYQESQQTKTPKKGVPKKLLLGIGIGCGAVAVVGVIIFVVSQLLMSNPIAKIGTAAVNTFESGEFAKAFDPTGILKPDGMGVELLLEVDGESIGMNVAYQQSKNRKIANAKVDLDIDGEKLALEGTVELDEDRLALGVPQMGDTIYTYYYTRENDGFLIDQMDDDAIEMLNEGLTKIYEFGSTGDSEEAQKAMVNLITEELNALEIEELEKDKFEVNGKDVQCGGYMLTITEDNMLNIVDGMAGIYEEYYSESMDDLLDEMYVDADDYFEELEYSFEDMPDIELSFYLYKMQIACIKMEADGEDGSVYVYFYGGDYPTQNMEVIAEYDDDEYSICKVEGSVKNQVETILLEVDEEEICEINYNQKTGELEVSGEDYYEFDLSAVVNRKGNTLTLEVNEFEMYGVDASGSIVITGDVNVKSLSGEEFDIGNASEDDFEDLADDLQDFIEDNEALYYYF